MIEFINLMILSLVINLINFAFLSLAEFGHFDTFPGGWGISRLKTISAQLKLKLGPSLAKILQTGGNNNYHNGNDSQSNTWYLKSRKIASKL